MTPPRSNRESVYSTICSCTSTVVPVRHSRLTGTAQPFPDEKVKSGLTEVAKLLYEQMKLNPDHRLRVSSVENLLSSIY